MPSKSESQVKESQEHASIVLDYKTTIITYRVHKFEC